MRDPAQSAGSQAERNATMLARARAFVPVVFARRDEIEAARQLPLDLARDMAAAGLFRLLTTQALGGEEVDPLTAFRIMEELSYADGSVGWAVMIGTGNSAGISLYLSDEGLAEIVGPDRDVVVALSAVPKGRARIVDGGAVVTGQWPFASGCLHSAWLGGLCRTYDGDVERKLPGGAPDGRVAFARTSECRIVDTWHTAGLRGTGSHDFAMTEVFVPARRLMSVRLPTPRPLGPLDVVRWPAIGHGAHALGIARRALETVKDLATNKTAFGYTMVLRERATVQCQVAQAEALVASAHAFVREAIEETWALCLAGREVPLALKARVRLAITHAVRSSAMAVDLLYDAGGGTSIYASSPLERCFRDVHVATQHIAVATGSYEPVGRVLLGLDPGPLPIPLL